MLPPRYKSYHELNHSPIKRVRVLINRKYLFTVGLYNSEMGFFIDFPGFSEYTTTSGNAVFPKGSTYEKSISLQDGKKENFCPKVSFHESGEVLFSKKEWFRYRPFARNKAANSIYDHDGDHCFTVMFQNHEKLTDDTRPEGRDVTHLSFPFTYHPTALKFVGNIWPEEALKKDFPSLPSMRYRSMTPITWLRPETKDIHDLMGIIKLSHENKAPLYVTLRCIPIPFLDKNENSPLISVIGGWRFNEVKDGEHEAKFIGLIARKLNN